MRADGKDLLAAERLAARIAERGNKATIIRNLQLEDNAGNSEAAARKLIGLYAGNDVARLQELERYGLDPDGNPSVP